MCEPPNQRFHSLTSVSQTQALLSATRSDHLCHYLEKKVHKDRRLLLAGHFTAGLALRYALPWWTGRGWKDPSLCSGYGDSTLNVERWLAFSTAVVNPGFLLQCVS